MKMTSHTLLKLSCFIGCILTCLSSDAPRVRIDSGEITGGRQYTYNKGRQFYSFIGIPYASPPVGKYRFKEPQPLRPWLDVWNATAPPSACLATQSIGNGIIGQEDCLYLNVYTPKLPRVDKSGSLMDVVVHIHGGAYMGGQGIIHGPEYLLDDNDFVFVTINYRLGVLGFATTGDGVLPANNGMKDQVAALQWIRRNIAAFGGDPDKVTITGMSAGASSVHYHMISPMSNGLFNRAILQSGSAYCHWSYAENVTQKTSRVAEILGCPTSSSEKIVECLRSRPAKNITISALKFRPWLNNPFSPFGPTIESAVVEPRFLPDIPEKLVAHDVPVLISITQDEGYFLTVGIISNNAVDDLNNNWIERLPYLLDYNYTISNEFLKSKIAKDIKKYYFGDKPISIVTENYITKMVSDRMFRYPVSKAAQNIASTNTAPVYFYEFGYSGKYSNFVDPTYHSRGSYVTHGDETMYVLKMDGKTPHDNEIDAKMIKTMVNIWASFIKTGVPDIGNSATWLPVSKNSADPFKYIKITQDQTFEFKEDLNYGNYEFWSSLPLTEFDQIRISKDKSH